MSIENWQPIETAPKDGTRLLVFSPVDGVVSSHWEAGTWQGLPWRAPHNAAKAAPTYWMPLPAPPETVMGSDT